jgi:hypothetical protein
MAKDEVKTYEVKELVESKKTHFGNGFATKTGENGKKQYIYLRKVKNEDGTTNEKQTKVMVSLYIAGDQEKNERSNFKNYAVSLELAKTIKAGGIDLGKPIKTPIMIRFTISENYDAETNSTRVLRELTNVAVRNDGNWDWIIKPKTAEPKTEEDVEKVEIDDDDLPF